MKKILVLSLFGIFCFGEEVFGLIHGQEENQNTMISSSSPLDKSFSDVIPETPMNSSLSSSLDYYESSSGSEGGSDGTPPPDSSGVMITNSEDSSKDQEFRDLMKELNANIANTADIDQSLQGVQYY